MYGISPQKILYPQRRRCLARAIARYSQPLSRAEIERIQVERFNRMWARCLVEVPFYRSWRAEHALPERIDRPADLAAFPVLDKPTVVARTAEVFQNGAITDFYTTGGSCGEPARFPKGPAEMPYVFANNYVGRSWWGIAPGDALFLLWGHSHVFGTGMRGQRAQVRRRLADHLANITRMNAYDMTDRALRADYEALRRRDPYCLMGYTSTVFRLARYLERNNLSLGHPRRLRAVILTAETVSDADIVVVERVFRAPVVIEYGAAELGVVALSRNGTRPLHVLWGSYICLVTPTGELRITTLDPRLFPLVNYGIGDVAEAWDSENGNALSLRSVLGRRQDEVRLRTVTGEVVVLSALLPMHILKSRSEILALQFRQERSDTLRVYLQADRTLDLAEMTRYFVHELRRDHPDLDPASVSCEQVAQPVLTRAGKHLLMLPPAPPASAGPPTVSGRVP